MKHLRTLSVITFILSAALAVPSTYAMVEITKYSAGTELTGSISPCLSIPDWQDRIECFSNLCEPSYACGEVLVLEATQYHGPITGTRVLDDLLVDPKIFSMFTDGHEFSHIVGRTQAKVKGVNGDSFLECPEDYLYGCPHGFFEQALGEAEGDTIAVSTEICEGVNTHPVQRSRFYCYHGVGHGILMAKQNDIYESVRICDKLPYPNAMRGCWQGAFMENINTVITGQDREGVFTDEDPLKPCNDFPVEKQWECYENHSAYLMKLFENDIIKSAKSCLKAHEDTMPSCILSLAQFATNPGWQEVILGKNPEFGNQGSFLKNSVHICNQFPSKVQHQCHMSAMNNTLNYDKFDQAVEYCGILTEEDNLQRDCYQRLGNELLWRGKTKEEMAQLCTGTPEKYMTNCTTYGDVKVYAPPRLADDEFAWIKTEENVEQPSETVEESRLGFFGSIKNILLWPFSIFSNSDTTENTPAPTSTAVTSPAVGNTSSSMISNQVIRFMPNKRFSPSEITISVGETVTWINDTDDLFWPASDVHPTHEKLSEFDASKPLKPERAYSYTFAKSGAWTFHDHLNPAATGVVYVK
jgi:plastocyanin